LLTAALVASGLNEPEAVCSYQVRFEELVLELDRSLIQGLTAKAKYEAIFDFLHRRILTGGYELNCTDLTQAFDEGRFNCVSASVLFNCLASRFGLEARAVEVPGHAMSRLVFEDGTIDVETTYPGWFRLADDPEKRAELTERRLGFCPTDRRRTGQIREVSDIEFVATIYYNRGIDLLGEKRFAEALAANAKAVRLDPGNDTARGNLLATLNNWAIDLGSAGRFAEAARLLTLGIQIDPDYDVLKGNHVHIYIQWAESLCQEGNYQMAVRLLAAASREQPDNPHFEKAQLDVHRRWNGLQLQGLGSSGRRTFE
jgi:tetratricopeptide (TPR) repeat protein